ncbi:MAG: hypothetical protein K5945_02865 [Bacteroidaceae bacterium]|nr:hypothetical protein [Bacteroidaceae bacterium]
MKKILTCLTAILSVLALHAQGTGGQSLITATGGITFEKTYHVEVGYHYVFFNHIALGGNVGCWAEYSGDALPAREAFDGMAHRLSRPYLKPSVMLFTPPFVNLSLLRLKLGVEGSLMISPRFTNTLEMKDANGQDMLFNYRSRTCAWGAAAWLQAEIVKVMVGVGYSVTSLELSKHYSATTLQRINEYPQGVFARVGVFF